MPRTEHATHFQSKRDVVLMERVSVMTGGVGVVMS